VRITRTIVLRVACLGLAVLLAGPAGARGPRLEIRGEHPSTEVPGEGGYVWLRPNQLVDLVTTGPGPTGLRVRQVLSEGRAPLPVDLTVVRDDQEQGTVRFRTPPPDGARAAGMGALSGPLVVRLDVPEGPHLYRLLVSGEGQGILIQPWLGDLQLASVVATPGSAEVLKPRPPKARPAPRRLEAEPPDELEGLVLTPPEPDEVEIQRILSAPPAQPPPFGHAFWVSGSLALVLLLGGTGCMAAGGAEQAAAADEPVQLLAHEHLGHADQAFLSGGVLYGLGGTAALLALVFYLVAEEPDPPGGGATLEPAPGGLGLRF